MSMSVKQDWQRVLTVAGTLRARSHASAIQDTSWALMAGNATVSYLKLNYGSEKHRNIPQWSQKVEFGGSSVKY